MQEEREYSFFGFHGTAESCAIGIVAAQSFNYGTPREDHWLGKGAYFFKEDELQAEYWAKNKVRNHGSYRGQKPFVVEVNIKVNESNFLNLDTRKGLEDLDLFLEEFERQGLSITTTDETKPEKVRCYLLSLLPDSLWVIQRTFDVKSKRFDENLQLKEMELNLHGTQICVRDNEAISPNSIELKEIKMGVNKPLRKAPRLF